MLFSFIQVQNKPNFGQVWIEEKKSRTTKLYLIAYKMLIRKPFWLKHTETFQFPVKNVDIGEINTHITWLLIKFWSLTIRVTCTKPHEF